jgi:hypothetical protein
MEQLSEKKGEKRMTVIEASKKDKRIERAKELRSRLWARHCFSSSRWRLQERAQLRLGEEICFDGKHLYFAGFEKRSACANFIFRSSTGWLEEVRIWKEGFEIYSKTSVFHISARRKRSSEEIVDVQIFVQDGIGSVKTDRGISTAPKHD